VCVCERERESEAETTVQYKFGAAAILNHLTNNPFCLSLSLSLTTSP